MQVALLGAAVADREQAVSRAPGGAVLRIGEDVGRAVGENEPRAGDDSASAQASARAWPDARAPRRRPCCGRRCRCRQGRACAACATSSSGCEAPRRKEKLVVTAKLDGKRAHANSRAGTSAARARVAVKALAVEPEAAAVAFLDAEIIARQRAPLSSRHHSIAMRSGPSACATSCSARRQRNRTGGRPALGDGLDRLRPPAAGSAVDGEVITARGSGGTRPSRRPFRRAAPARARRPRRTPGYACPAAPGASRGAGRSARRAGRPDGRSRRHRSHRRKAGLLRIGQRSATSAVSRTMSKPKPGSSAIANHGEPLGEQLADARGIAQRPRVPTSSRNTLPSVRNSASWMRRAPSPRRSSIAASCRASCSMVPSTSSSRAIGSAKALLGDARRDRQARRDRLVARGRAPDRGGARTRRRSARRAARAARRGCRRCA